MELITFIELFFILLVGHAVCDYALQPSNLRYAKNHNTPESNIYWPWALTAHGLINGGWVYIITGSFVIGILETITHSIIDYFSDANYISFRTEQLLQIGTKVIWIILIVMFPQFIEFE